MRRSPNEIILRPLFTEKTSTSLQSEGTDGVGRRLQARIDRGDVEPRPKYTVRTMNVRGKKKRMGRTMGRRPHWKKAIIEVADGPVDVLEGA